MRSGSTPAKENSRIYPNGLYDLLLKFKKYNLPIFILENGICTEDDNLRWDYIYEHLKSIHRAMSEGAKVLGYIYWSLIDNFEWAHGYGPKFGLVDVNYTTQKRSARPSAHIYAEIIKDNAL